MGCCCAILSRSWPLLGGVGSLVAALGLFLGSLGSLLAGLRLLLIFGSLCARRLVFGSLVSFGFETNSEETIIPYTCSNIWNEKTTCFDMFVLFCFM